APPRRTLSDDGNKPISIPSTDGNEFPHFDDGSD
ncbi:MAG: hypothetical protein BDTLLHRC_000184, partial [Candidatus Fervidibacter sp.]